MADIEDSILTTPSPSTSSQKENAVPISLDSSSESEWSEDETEETLLKPTPEKPIQHPHFKEKRSKTSHAPLKCINVSCREEKNIKDKEILCLKEKVKVLKEELH